MKYIDAEKLIAEIRNLRSESCISESDEYYEYAKSEIIDIINSLQQEQPNDLYAVIKEYYREELPLEDERTKAAYHFFVAGKCYELKEIEEERTRHITALLDNFQQGMKTGYKKALIELKEGKIECSPIMKEFIDKLLELGNTFNYGFGPNIQQEQPEVDLERDAVQFCFDKGLNVTPYQAKTIARHFYGLRNLALEEAARHVYESWMGGTMDDVRRDMVELGRVINARKEE